MSGTNGNGSDRYFAMLRIEQIEHKIGLRNPINRAEYAILRCSVCYPHQSEIAVRPEIDGSFETFVAQVHERIKKRRPVRKEDIKEEVTKRDHRGEPVPLSWDDLKLIARLYPHQAVRALGQLREEGVLAEGHPFRLLEVPTVVPPFEILGPTAQIPENFDKSFVINKNIKKLQNFLGVRLHCAETSDKAAQEMRAQFLEKLCAVRREKEKETRDQIRAAIEENCADTGILIESSKSFKRVSESANGAGKQADHSPTPLAAAEPPNARIDKHVERKFGRFKPGDDALQSQFNALPAELQIPAGAVRKLIDDKIEEKKRKGYPIDSLGALLGFVRIDGEKWIAQNAETIRYFRAAEAQRSSSVLPASAAAEPDPYFLKASEDPDSPDHVLACNLLGREPQRKSEPRAKAQEAGQG